MQPEISPIFNRFVGREVELQETIHQMTIGGKAFEIPEYKLVENQPVIEELRGVTELYGLQLRLWLPDTVGTMEVNTNRVNMHVDKSGDGKYRISDRISIDASAQLKETIASRMVKGSETEVPVMKPLRLKVF
jgi:hypothetical protein